MIIKSQHLTIAELLKVKNKRGHYSAALSPEDARFLLSFNHANRRLRKAWVNNLVEIIESGNWQNDHPQPIVFGDDGSLLDGQHRLHALNISLPPSGTIVVTVDTGVPVKVREFLDTGAPRVLCDRVRVSDDEKTNKIAGLLCATRHRLNSTGGLRSHRLLPDDLRAFWERHSSGVCFVSEVHTKNKRGVSCAGVLFALMEMFERNGSAAREFYDSLMSQAPDIKQAQMLLNYLLQVGRHGKIGTAETRDAYERSVTAMKAYLEHREIKQLKRTSSW